MAKQTLKSTIKCTARVRAEGTGESSLAITIPADIVKLKGLKKGDLLMIEADAVEDDIVVRRVD